MIKQHRKNYPNNKQNGFVNEQIHLYSDTGTVVHNENAYKINKYKV